MALRRISQLDPVLHSTTDPIPQEEPVYDVNYVIPPESSTLTQQIRWFVQNNPLLSGYLMEVSQWNGERPNAPSYYLSKQFDLSSLVAIISADITGSLDITTKFQNHERGMDSSTQTRPLSSWLTKSLSAINIMYRDTWHRGYNTFENSVHFHNNVIITGEGDYPREPTPEDPTKMSAVMTTGKHSRNGNTSQFEVQVPSKFFYPINACAMSAWWADLAEVYDADGWYAPGTLVQFGGEREITIASTEVNAVVTTNPGFILNTGNHNEYSCPIAIAMTGRTPVLVSGAVKKFDRIILDPNTHGTGIVAEKGTDEKDIIAVALESSGEPSPKRILCATRFKL